MTRRNQIDRTLFTAWLAAWLVFAAQVHAQNEQSDAPFGDSPSAGPADELDAATGQGQEAASESAGQGSAATRPGGGGSYGGGGGYSGDYGGEMSGVPGGMGMGGYAGEGFDPPGVLVRSGKNRDGSPRWTKITADRIFPFQYRFGSMKPQKWSPGDGGEGYGEGDMYGGGMENGYGGSMGGYGGEYGAAGHGREDYAGEETAGASITIYGYVFDHEWPADSEAEDRPVDGRSMVYLLIKPMKPQSRPAGGNKGQGYGGGYSGAPGSGAEGIYGGYGSDMYGTTPTPTPRMDRLDVLLDQQKDRAAAAELEVELELVASIIRQTIWKEDLVRQLNKNAANPQQLEAAEKTLKQVLTEEYETQLVRQELEIAGIERRVSKLREELSRRRNAKQRVVDVQLGRIVLEAQGLLGR